MGTLCLFHSLLLAHIDLCTSIVPCHVQNTKHMWLQEVLALSFFSSVHLVVGSDWGQTTVIWNWTTAIRGSRYGCFGPHTSAIIVLIPAQTSRTEEENKSLI